MIGKTTIEKEFGKLVCSVIVGGALQIWIGNNQTRWLYTVFAGIATYGILSIIGYRKNILRWIKKSYFSIIKEPMIEPVPGFCGRDSVIKEIYSQYCLTKKLRIILICGLGGSGKTTIYSNFCKALVNSPRVELFSTSLSTKSLHNRTILFVDYAYESIDSINDMISKLKEKKKKRILVVLLERTYAKRYFSENIDRIINLNDQQYTLNSDDLAKIITYNVSNQYHKEKGDFIDTGKSINDQKAKNFATQITDVIDPIFHRPIFAFIIAELYRDDESRNFAETISINLLLEMYWQKKTRDKYIQRIIKAKDYPELKYNESYLRWALENVKQLVVLVTLFCSMTRLQIIYNIRKEVVLKYNGETLYDNSLESYLKSLYNTLLDDNMKLYLITGILDIEDLGTVQESKEGAIIVINAIKFDIVSAWLLGKCYKEKPQYTQHLGMMIKNISCKMLDKAVLSFIVRTTDEDHNDIIRWYLQIKCDFNDYTTEDFYDIVMVAIAKLEGAVRNHHDKTKEAIRGFLEECFDTMCEHFGPEEIISTLCRLEEEIKNMMSLPEATTIVSDVIFHAKTTQSLQRGETR